MEESWKTWPESTLEAQNLLLFLKRISWFSRLLCLTCDFKKKKNPSWCCVRKGHKAWQHKNRSNVVQNLICTALANTELDAQSCTVMSSIQHKIRYQEHLNHCSDTYAELLLRHKSHTLCYAWFCLLGWIFSACTGVMWLLALICSFLLSPFGGIMYI